MKKRIVAGLLVLCMVLVLGLTACQGQDTAATTPTTTAANDDAATTTAADTGDETTTAAEGEAPATWENLSWDKDTSPISFECY